MYKIRMVFILLTLLAGMLTACGNVKQILSGSDDAEQVFEKALTDYCSGDDCKSYDEHYLIDLDQDGCDELIVKTGTCAADSMIYFYKLSDGTCLKTGELSGEHANLLYSRDFGLYRVRYNMGNKTIYRVITEENQISETLIYETYPEPGEEYEYPEETESMKRPKDVSLEELLKKLQES